MRFFASFAVKNVKFYYLTDSSEKSLAPFFSPKILSAALYSIVIICVILVVSWPWKFNMGMYMRQGEGPFTFFPVMTAALVIYGYVQLRCGRGEMIKSRFSESYLRQLSTFEQEYSFIGYAFVEFLLHISFLILLIVPVLMVVTSVSGLSFMVLMKGISIVFTTALLCRLIGFMTYLLWGRGGILGYLVSRVLMCLFLFITAINFPVVNPIRLLYALNKNQPNFGASPSLEVAYWFNIGAASGLIVVLSLMNHVLVRHRMRREHELT